MFHNPSLFLWLGVIMFATIDVIIIYKIIIYLDSWLNRSYYLSKFIKERDYYLLALNESRENGREGETLAILKKTIKFNQKLAEKQSLANHYLYSSIVDPKILDIEPIK